MSAEILKRRAQDVIGMGIQTRGGFWMRKARHALLCSINIISSGGSNIGSTGGCAGRQVLQGAWVPSI